MNLREDIKDMKKEIEDVKNQSFTLEILHDYKTQNKRQFIVILVILGMWFVTIGYLIYILNDIGVETTTTTTSTTETIDIDDVDNIENSHIHNK